MNLHSNTVRYRINKVKEILNIDKSEFGFYEELSIGIKLYMIYQNMIDLDIPSVDYILKYGDTIADIKEGRNAKVWTVGVILGSNEMGLTEKEVADMPDQELETRKAEVRKPMLDAGAHFVVDTIKELPSVIDTINKKLNNNNSK